MKSHATANLARLEPMKNCAYSQFSLYAVAGTEMIVTENDERGAKDDVVRPGEHWLLYAGTGFSAGYRVGDQAGAPETRSLCAQSRRRPDGPTLRSAC